MSDIAVVAIISTAGECLMEIIEGQIPNVGDALTDWGINVTNSELAALMARGGAFTSDTPEAEYSAIRYSDYSG